MANENEQALALQEARLQEAKKQEAQPGHRRTDGPRVGPIEGGLMGAFTAVNALLDYLVVGSIPIVGDILDGITWFVISMWVWMRGFKKPPLFLMAGAVEFIPGGDLIPVYLAMVIVIVIYNNSPLKKLASVKSA